MATTPATALVNIKSPQKIFCHTAKSSTSIESYASNDSTSAAKKIAEIFIAAPQQPQQQQQQQTTEQQQQQQQQSTNTPHNLTCQIRSCALSPDACFLAWSCECDYIVKVANIANTNTNTNTNDTQQQQHAIACDLAEIDCCEKVLSLTFGTTTAPSTRRRRRTISKPKVNTRFHTSDDCLILAIGTMSGRIRIYDVLKKKLLFVLFHHNDAIRGLRFSKDGSLRLASASHDGLIKLWDIVDDGNMYKTLAGHIGKVYAVDWSPTDSTLCTVGSNRQAFVWDIDTHTIVHRLVGHSNNVIACEFSPDGGLLATASYDTKVLLWDPHSGRLMKQFYHLLPPPSLIFAGGQNGAFLRGLAFSSGGDHVVSICDDKKLRIWSLNGESVSPLAETVCENALCCAYSPKGKIIVGTKDNCLNVYDVPLASPTLMSICRKVVNKMYNHDSIGNLCLPNELKRFLHYEDIRSSSAK